MIFTVSIGKAQKQIYKQYTSQDGLCNSCIYRVCQDSNGYLWMTTNYGISMFDGYEFRNFFHRDFKKTSIGIDIDNENNRVYVGDVSGELFSVRNNVITKNAIKGIYPNAVIDIKVRGNILWILYKDNSLAYLKDDILYPYEVYNKNGVRLSVYSMYINNNGNLLFATQKGVYIHKSLGIDSLFILEITDVQIHSITENYAGQYYFGGVGVLYNWTDGLLSRIPLRKKEPVIDIATNMNNAPWVLFNGIKGLYSLSDSCHYDFSKRIGLQNIFINDLFSTKDGTLILATYGKGLYVINDLGVVLYSQESGLGSNNIYDISEDQDHNIYVGGYGGVWKFENDSFKRSKNIIINDHERVNKISFIEEDVWIATSNQLMKYSRSNQTLYSSNVAGNDIISIGNEIILGGYSGLFKVNKLSLKNDIVIGRVRVNQILPIQNGVFCVATDSGAFRFSGGKVEVEYHGSVKSIVSDSQSNRWLATDNGLVKIDSNNNKFTYTTDSGLCDDFCTHLQYRNDTIWIGTMRGITTYTGGLFKQHISNKVTLSEEVLAMYIDSKNYLWWSIGNGLYRQDLNNSTIVKQPNLIIRKIYNKSCQFNKDSLIELTYDDNNIVLDFTAIEYRIPKDIYYEYRFSNIYKEWQKTKNRSLNFSSLSFGNYILEIRASNGFLYSDSIKMNIIVLKPYWAKAWFLVCIIIAIALIVSLLIIKRISHVKQKYLKDIGQLKLQQKATTTLVSPHFIFNSLNSIQSFINRSDKFSANQYISQFARLIRSTLENVSREEILLKEELHILEDYLGLECLRLGSKLTYTITVDNELNTANIVIPTMLIQPYVENAVWHGIMPKEGKGSIAIKIIMTSSAKMKITIEDDGIGYKDITRKDTVKHTSFGMNVNKKRLDIIEKITGESLEVNVMPVKDRYNGIKGTIVTLLIPHKVLNRS